MRSVAGTWQRGAAYVAQYDAAVIALEDFGPTVGFECIFFRPVTDQEVEELNAKIRASFQAEYDKLKDTKNKAELAIKFGAYGEVFSSKKVVYADLFKTVDTKISSPACGAVEESQSERSGNPTSALAQKGNAHSATSARTLRIPN